MDLIDILKAKCWALQVVTPGYMRIVKNEGMPKSKQPGQKGNLRIVFDVQVPTLTPWRLPSRPHAQDRRDTCKEWS